METWVIEVWVNRNFGDWRVWICGSEKWVKEVWNSISDDEKKGRRIRKIK